MPLHRLDLSCLRSYIRQSGSLCRYFFQLWDTYNFSSHSQLFAHHSELETGFLFQRDQYVTFSGDLTQQDLLVLKWEPKKYILSFDQTHWPLITSVFENFHPTDETGDPNKSLNHFFIMKTHLDQWNRNRQHLLRSSPDITILMVTPNQEIEELKERVFDIAFLSSLPTILLFDGKNPEPAAMGRIPNILSKDEWSFGVIRNVWVHPAYRRRGYGSLIVDRALRWLFEEQNIVQAFLYVESTNAPAVTFYNKLGWQMADEILSCYAYPSASLCINS